MTFQLVRYEQARTALAECHRVDEVKDIRDKAEAMAAYARQAKDSELIQYATEIKVRAERRCGELTLTLSSQQGARRDVPTSPHRAEKSKAEHLADHGISTQEASRYERLAAMPAEHFETAVATAKATAGEVTTAFMLREAAKNKPQGKPVKGARADAMREELKAASDRGVSMLITYARLTLNALRAQDSVTDEEGSLLRELADVIAQKTAER